MAEHESSLAVLVDFENMARPGAKGRNDFDIHLVLDRLAEKGRVLVKRAYADWSRYRDARHELQNAGLGLIEMPSAREGAKNRADIQMAVNAMELAYSRDHVDNFVIVSGDSDFTPLVGKLRELNKRVIGVGNRESASDLLVANCDEFIYYDTLVARAGGGSPRRRGSAGGLNPVQLLQETLTALQREGIEWPLASVVKDSMRRKYPAFDETDHGFSTFSKFLEDAAGTGLVKIETDPRSGTYRVELADTTAPPPAPAAAPSERAAADEGEGRRRRRRGGRRGEPAPAEPVVAGTAAEEDEDEDAEVFEVRIEPTPDPDLGALPPLDEPISYEDMIMLGPAPEVGEDVPDLVEATDMGAGEPPPRSSRRRRRRAAVAEPEPTVADLEPVDEELVVLVPDVAEEPVPAEPEPAAAAEAPAEADEAAGTRRRRRRRVTGPAEPEPAPAAAESAPEPEAEAAAPVVDVEGPPVAVPDPAAPAEAATPRRRVRRRSAAAEAAEAAAAEAPAGEPAGEAAAEEAPKPPPADDAQEGRAGGRGRRGRGARRRGGAEAAPADDAQEGRAGGRGGRAAAEEAPKPRRRTTRKKAEPAAEAASDGAAPAEADEAPKPRRRTTRKKAEPAAEPEPVEARLGVVPRSVVVRASLEAGRCQTPSSPKEVRMRLHANARLGPRGRLVMVERVIAGWTVRDAACSAGVSPQTCRKWLARYRAEGARRP